MDDGATLVQQVGGFSQHGEHFESRILAAAFQGAQSIGDGTC